MAKQRTWKFDIDGNSHEVILKEGRGNQIWLDGEAIYKSQPGLLNTGAQLNFEVAGHPVDVGMLPGVWKNEYYLRLDDEFLFPLEEQKKQISKRIQGVFDDQANWKKLGEMLGLGYYPIDGESYGFRHRLIGYFAGFLVVVQVGLRSSGNASVPGIFVLVRHHEIELERAKAIKKEVELRKFLKDSKISVEWLNVETNYTLIFMRSIKKTIGENENQRVRGFLSIITKYVQPTYAEKCEGLKCKMPVGNSLQLVFVNGVPYRLCQDCLDNIANIGEASRAEYQKAPLKLIPGIAYGMLAALAGSVLIGLIIAFLDIMGAIFGVLTFSLVVKAMDKVGTKRTFLSLLIAAILGLAGSILGTYLGVIGYLLKEGEIDSLNLEILWDIAQYYLLEEPELLRQTILFALFGIIPYLFIGWNANRKYLQKVFVPDIEVIRTF